MTGGSAGGGGYRFQAKVIALVQAHLLAQRPLDWLRLDHPDVPLAVSAETGGAGDDLRIELAHDLGDMEVQVKRGLRKDRIFWEAIDKFAQNLPLDLGARGILAVDPSASSTIRDDLLLDLKRLEQGRYDDLHSVTMEVLERFKAAGIADPTGLAERLSVVVLDIEHDGSGGSGLARELLAAILEETGRADTVWRLLCEDGLRLIQERGRSDAAMLVRLLGRNRLQLAAANPGIVLSQYIGWIEERAATFSLPGLPLALSITRAWTDLQVVRISGPDMVSAPEALASELSTYRGMTARSRRGEQRDARLLVEGAQRLIVIGGPGSGKSTLCRRVAHDLAAAGQRVLWVRLPLVASRLRQGETIDEAILHAAADGFGPIANAVQDALNVPDCLLADGLDECGAERHTTAEALSRWALSRGRTRVVVTTRSVGFDPASFVDWQRAELIPLDLFEIEQYVGRVIGAAFGDSIGAGEAATEFQSELAANQTAARAARNPLLLGFLIQLSLAGIALGASRAALYEQVIELWRQRSERVVDAELPESVQTRSLELIGWLLHTATEYDRGISRRQLIARLAPLLRDELGEPYLRASSTAESCVAFWEGQGVLEHLRAGREDAYVFVHLSLGEFAAARYVAGLGSEELRRWLRRVARDPRWREVILLAAEAGQADSIVSSLVELDEPGALTSTEACIAATVVADTPVAAEHTDAVVARIAERLVSPVPLVAYEAAEAAVGTAAKSPLAIASHIVPLIGHTQTWTRLGALQLALKADCEGIDLEIVEHCLATRPLVKPVEYVGSTLVLNSSPEGDTWNEVVGLGAELLATRQPGPATADLLERLLESGQIATMTEWRLLRALTWLGRREFVDGHRKRAAEAMPARFGSYEDDHHNADLAALEAVLRITAAIPPRRAARRTLWALGTLLHALDFTQVAAGDWYVLGRRRDPGSLDAVLVGTAAAAGVDLGELASDAALAYARLQEGPTERLYSFLPEIEPEVDWRRARGTTMPPENLVRALRHSSRMIAVGAAQLLAAGVARSQALPFVEHVLVSGGDQALEMVAAIAPFMWRARSLELIVSRLAGELPRGCRWLFRALPSLPGAPGDGRVPEALLRGVDAGDAEVATMAAAALLQLDPAAVLPMAPALRGILDRWTDDGVPCDRCGGEVKGGSCPSCHIVPHSPRADLIRALARAGAVSVEELLTLGGDERHDVVEAARECLAGALAGDEDRIREVIGGIGAGRYNIKMLDAVLNLPAASLRPMEDAMLALVQSPLSPVRHRLLAALPGAEWTDSVRAVQVAEGSLADRDAGVRDRAARTLRTLTARG